MFIVKALRPSSTLLNFGRICFFSILYYNLYLHLYDKLASTENFNTDLLEECCFVIWLWYKLTIFTCWRRCAAFFFFSNCYVFYISIVSKTFFFFSKAKNCCMIYLFRVYRFLLYETITSLQVDKQISFVLKLDLHTDYVWLLCIFFIFPHSFPSFFFYFFIYLLLIVYFRV